MSTPNRNDPCPCGSGKKYKKCCLTNTATPMQSAPAQAAQPGGRGVNATNSAPPSGFLMQAVALHQAGRLDEAEAAYRRLLTANPDDSDALHYLGLIALQRGRHQEAVDRINSAIRITPLVPAFHCNLGNAYGRLGNPDSAIAAFSEAVRLDPMFHAAFSNMGNIFLEQGRLDDAAASFRKAISLRPDFAEAHYNLGNTLRSQGKLDEAVACYRKAISIRPDYAEAHNNLGIVLHALDKLDAAAASYRKAISLKPDYAEAYLNLGGTLQGQGKRDEAIASVRQAILLKPDHAEAHTDLALILIESGQFDEAREEITTALTCKPEHPVAWAMLVELRKMTPEDKDWLDTALRLMSPSSFPLTPAEAAKLQFAIGKYYDDIKQYDLAFAAFRKANSIARQVVGEFDRVRFSRLIDDLIAAYSADEITRQHKGASSSPRPVFIVGMPRSGTSLLEQIIASHPQAYGAGELTFWGAQAETCLPPVIRGNFKPELLAKIASEYEQHLQRHSAEAARVVDKMPNNFCWLGLITTAFPQAKIIHARRNPVDTCLSIYFQNFSSTAHSYGCDLEDLAYYYREYERLMRHWRAVLPAERFLEVPYESLVDNQADWSRRIIEFIGLDWDEHCLEFHKTERRVGTASNWQVRQKIYSSSKARWRNYEKHLGSLLGLLDLGQDQG